MLPRAFSPKVTVTKNLDPSLAARAPLQPALAHAHTPCWRSARRVLMGNIRTRKRRYRVSAVQSVSTLRLLARACAMRVMLGRTRLWKVLRLASGVRTVGTLLLDRLAALIAQLV